MKTKFLVVIYFLFLSKAFAYKGELEVELEENKAECNSRILENRQFEAKLARYSSSISKFAKQNIVVDNLQQIGQLIARNVVLDSEIKRIGRIINLRKRTSIYHRLLNS